MSCGMKRNVYAVDVDGLSIGNGLKIDVGRESEFEDVFVSLGGEVVLVVVSGVVSVGVGDEGFVNGFMGVDEDIGGGAVETGGGGDEQGFWLFGVGGYNFVVEPTLVAGFMLGGLPITEAQEAIAGLI